MKYQHRRPRGTGTLWALVLLAIGYAGLLLYVRTFTGTRLLDGAITVIVGLYVCSHPAANAVDLIFLQRGALREISSEWSGLGWLMLNVLVMFVGWLVIVIGATRFVG
jgi:hypothetical protein